MLTSATAAMLALPLVPAGMELIRRRDAAPLAARKDDGNIHNFIVSFRRYIESAQPALASCIARNSMEEVRLRDGQYALVVGVAGHCGEIDPNFPNPALFSRAVWLRDEQQFTKDVYAADVLHAGKHNVFRAVLGEKDIFLGKENQVLRWIHAEGSVIAAAGSNLFGRLSAGKSICVSPGCRFERAHAPIIFAGTDTQVPFATPVPRNGTAAEARKTPEKLGRSRIHGDVRLRSGDIFLGNIIVTGAIQVEKDTQILGSAKAHGDIRLHDRAQIEGAVVSNCSVHTGSNCYVKGPLLAEQEIYLGAGTRVGTPNSPTTVSAPRIRLASGCVIHGTVWARVEGRVEA